MKNLMFCKEWHLQDISKEGKSKDQIDLHSVGPMSMGLMLKELLVSAIYRVKIK